jgi:hypothetical protein
MTMKQANSEFFRRRLVTEGIASVVLLMGWVAFVAISLTPGLAA